MSNRCLTHIDALISINVPNDEARAVVDAMKRAMGTTIATKAGLQMRREAVAAESPGCRVVHDAI